LADLIQKSELQAILRKFKQPKFLEVARVICGVINKSNASTAANSNSQASTANIRGSRTTGSSNGKRGSSSTGKTTTSGSNLNSTQLSAKQMTIKAHLGQVSSAESRKI